MRLQVNVQGVATIDTDTNTFKLDGIVVGQPPLPPDVPPPSAEPVDAIDLSQVVMTAESPDVRQWPITSKLTSLKLNPGNNDDNHSYFDFTKRFGEGAWPFLEGPEGGDIQYTIWACCKILGVWYAAGSILCISRDAGDNYSPTGPILRAGQLPGNWYYFADSPMAGYQPASNEEVGWFLTSGVQRRKDDHVVAERTQVVLTPFREGVYTW